MFHGYFLDVLIKCTRKMFLLSPEPQKPMQGCHHGFVREEKRLSATYALDCKLDLDKCSLEVQKTLNGHWG